MIVFHTETDFKLSKENEYVVWIGNSISKMKKITGDINYIFCDDTYLLKINQDYLDHNTYTDIISFDYSEGDLLSGDIYISIERVKDNAKIFKVSFEEELQRVLIHGVLHFAGYNDSTEEEEKEMRNQENIYLSSFK